MHQEAATCGVCSRQQPAGAAEPSAKLTFSFHVKATGGLTARRVRFKTLRKHRKCAARTNRGAGGAELAPAVCGLLAGEQGSSTGMQLLWGLILCICESKCLPSSLPIQGSSMHLGGGGRPAHLALRRGRSTILL